MKTVFICSIIILSLLGLSTDGYALGLAGEYQEGITGARLSFRTEKVAAAVQFQSLLVSRVARQADNLVPLVTPLLQLLLSLALLSGERITTSWGVKKQVVKRKKTLDQVKEDFYQKTTVTAG